MTTTDMPNEHVARFNEICNLYLRIGHELELLGRNEEALEAYQRATSYDPKNHGARRKISAMEEILKAMKAEQVMENSPRSTRIMFDISDLIQYMRESRVPTGIQRVQLKIIYFALTEFRAQANPLVVHFDQAGSQWIPVEAELFLSLHNAAESGDDILEEELQEMLRRLDHSDLPPDYLDQQLQENDFILVNLGSSWWIENYFLKIRELRKKYGIRYVPMIHDVIPLMTSAHCSHLLVDEFCQWFSTLPFEVDGAVTNSEWSAMDVRHQVAKFLPQAVFPIHPIALNGDMRRDFSTRAINASNTINHLLPHDSSFVLCVGTLESRKNHLLLFKAWEKLLENHDATDVPFLVCLGKAGWLFDEAAEFLRARPALSAKIILISSVTDHSLAALYEASLFAVYNSFYEGWGLPVTESLAFGALPLIPCHTSLTEAGGRAAVYFRSNDLCDLSTKLETLIFNAEERDRLSNHARAHAKLRDWKDVAREFVDTIISIKPYARTRQEELLRVPIGRIIPLGKSNALAPSFDLALANLLRDGLNWHRLEYWGTWTRPGVATIRLPLPEDVIGEELILFLRFGGTAVDTSITISCWVDDQRLGAPIKQMVERLSIHSVIFRLKSESCNLSVTIDAGAGSLLGPGDRTAGIGVTHLMLCRGDDQASQQQFMDTFPDLYRPITNSAHVSVHQV
jgi:glycosyltransferase involved in cell wall biosynthesis